MDRSQWVSLIIVVLYILAEVLLPAAGPDSGGQSEGCHATRGHRGSLLLFVGVACIWWPDIAGAVLLGTRYGPVPDTWAIVVRVLGWIIVAGAILMWMRLL